MASRSQGGSSPGRRRRRSCSFTAIPRTRRTSGPLVYLMRPSSLVFLGADSTRPAPVDAVARVMIPVLLIASRQDEQIGFHHAELLRAALGANSEVDFHVLDRGRHGEAAELEPKVRDFFLAHL